MPEGTENDSRRVTAAAAVYTQLRRSILDMELRPGEALQERVLTERFGVSRTPVREALLQLSKDGLVNLKPQSGTFVALIPEASIVEAMVIRSVLEDTSVARAAARAGLEDVLRLDAILVRERLFAGTGQLGDFHETDESFHALIASIAGYPTIWTVIRQVKVQLDRLRRLTLPADGRMDQVAGEHKAIRDAIAGNDVEMARARMKAHLGVLAPDLDRIRREFPDYFT
jgi:DNA-binding GntR family transcriptional regulator